MSDKFPRSDMVEALENEMGANVAPVTRRPLSSPEDRAREGSRRRERARRYSDTDCPLVDMTMVLFSAQLVGFCAWMSLFNPRRTG